MSQYVRRALASILVIAASVSLLLAFWGSSLPTAAGAWQTTFAGIFFWTIGIKFVVSHYLRGPWRFEVFEWISQHLSHGRSPDNWWINACIFILVGALFLARGLGIWK